MQLHDVIGLQFHICFFIQTCSVEEAMTCHVPSSVHTIVRVPVLSSACEGSYADVHACVCARLHADMHLIIECMHFPHSSSLQTCKRICPTPWTFSSEPARLPYSCPHQGETLTRTCFARQWDPTTPKRLAFLVPCRVHSQDDVNQPTITRIDRAG